MKEWKELTLTDDYLFSQIMKDEEFCKLFLEMLMGIKITKVIYLEAQKEVNSNLPRSSKRSKPFPANKRYPYGRLP